MVYKLCILHLKYTYLSIHSAMVVLVDKFRFPSHDRSEEHKTIVVNETYVHDLKYTYLTIHSALLVDKFRFPSNDCSDEHKMIAAIQI